MKFQFTSCQMLLSMQNIFAVFLAASAFTAGTALQLPKYVTPCARSDPNFNDCVKEHARETLASPILEKGDRKYNIPALSPLLIKELDVSEGTGLKIKMRDVKIFGLLGASVEKLNTDFDKQQMDGLLRFPAVSIIGKYEAAGRILVLPLTGNGNINITLVNVTLPVDLDFSVQPIGSTKHFVVKDVRATALPSRAYIHLTNLLGNDKLLEKAMNDFLNNNWKEVFDIMAPSITAAIVKVLGNMFNGIAAVVPFDEVFPETLP